MYQVRADVFLPLVQTAILLATKHQLDNDNWVTDDFYTRAAVLVRRILKIG
jgi:hypothetical protein